MSEINIKDMIHRPSDDEIMAYLMELGVSPKVWGGEEKEPEQPNGN